MTINYDNIHQAIAALNQCAKENENRQTDTGAIRVSDLCTDVAYFLCKVRQDHNQWQETKDGKMHVYVFKDEEAGDIICNLWTTSVPDIGEQMILWDKGEHHHYKVTRRIYGANAEEKVGVWNLYVKPKRKGLSRPHISKGLCQEEESQAPSAVAGKAQEQINSNNQIKNIYDYEK